MSIEVNSDVERVGDRMMFLLFWMANGDKKNHSLESLLGIL